ncbi:MAG: glutathione synthase [Betaproteobacteria bacterium]|nr:glutathione synthase [Betaproteobacteria bacterium]
MNIAIILDPLEHIKTYKDTTYALMQEGAARGHHLFVLQAHDLVLEGGRVDAYARRVTLRSEGARWYALDEARRAPLSDYDVVLMRKDPPFDMEYLYATYLLERAEAQGARVVNRPAALRDFNEKLAILRFPDWIAPTLVSARRESLKAFVALHEDVILKPLDAMGGAGIFRVKPDDPNLNVILETMTQFDARTILAQRYIPEVTAGDKRILLIDGKPVPFALARIPQPGETRANLAAGGTGVAQALSARDAEIAAALGPKLSEAGLLLVGLDVIGDYLTEINVTSPTGMREIAAQTGFNAAAMMLDALERGC